MCVAVIYSVVILGENKVSFMSAVRFIKLLFQCKQPDAFTQLAGEMLQVLSVSSTQTALLFLLCRKRRIHSISSHVLCFYFEVNLCCVSE